MIEMFSKTAFQHTMKRILSIATLTAALSIQYGPGSHLQAAADPPALMSYQGFLTDGDGTPLANNQIDNFDVEFRIWTESTGGTLLWSEQQTVTVEKGHFSVFLGQGTATADSPANTTLSMVFTNAAAGNLFLGTTVKLGTGNDEELAPRLRLLTSPYAFLAQTAKQSESAGRLVGGTGEPPRINGALELLANGGTKAVGITQQQVGGAESATMELTTSDSSGAQATRILMRGNSDQADIEFHRGGRSAESAMMLLDAETGYVGIGTTEPTQKLDVAGDIRIRKTGNLSRILFDAQVNDPGGIVHFENNNTGELWLSSSDDWGAAASANDKIIFGDQGSAMRRHIFSANGDAYFSGKFGIGAINPQARLEIADGGGQHLILTSTRNDARNRNWLIALDRGTEGTFTITPSAAVNAYTFSNVALAIRNDGNVGIGTADPGVPLHVARNQSKAFPSHGRFNTYGVDSTDRNVTENIAIWADGQIFASGYHAASDARRKNVIRCSDRKEDLNTLLGIRITDYKFVDVMSSGDRSEKKVIAQQVEQVFPEAVSTTIDVVPDIYTKAEVEAGWVRLKNNLKAGEKVRLITEKGAQVCEVLEAKEDRFRVDSINTDGDIFVYGRQVDDARTVDYDALSMLNISATQRLYDLIQEQREVIEQQSAKLARIEAESDRFVSRLERRIVELERRLEGMEREKELASKQ